MGQSSMQQSRDQSQQKLSLMTMQIALKDPQQLLVSKVCLLCKEKTMGFTCTNLSQITEYMTGRILDSITHTCIRNLTSQFTLAT